MTILTKEDANQMALDYVTKLEHEFCEPLVLVNALTIEEPFGWVYFYDSREYLETGAFESTLLGNAPFIVNRNTGEICDTGTAKPVKDYIDDYKQKLSNR